ncbi:MAG TPA: glycosyltransferase family 2 protein [Steroidobacteraceae bacterium]|nr:glycosyltransferase family 2 protein [Steroidobacteraceae bacterium]
MPCLNEAATIGACVQRARDALDVLRVRHGMTGEVLVADNGSEDGSRELAQATGARVVPIAARGYGSALIRGFEAARGRFLVMADSDMSYDFMDAVPMVEALAAGADLCMGSRFAGEIRPGAMPWMNRYIGNPGLSRVLRILFKSTVSDAHCGIRALTRDCFDRLGLMATGMEFASEMVLKAAMLRMRVAEVPVTLSPDRRGRPPHLRPWRDGWRHLRYMLMLSPTWLFFAPAALFGVAGLAIFAVLLSQPGVDMVRIGPVVLGDHWMIAAGTMLGAASQTAIFGVAAAIYGLREGYRLPTPFVRRALRVSRLEFWLMAGFALMLAGLGGIASIVVEWASSGFGPLRAVRPLVAYSTALLIGAQLFYGGFLLSIISGNEARLTHLDAQDDTPARVAEQRR